MKNFQNRARLNSTQAFPQFFELEAVYASFSMFDLLLAPLLLFLALLKVVTSVSYRLFRFQKCFFSNHISALDNRAFVCEGIEQSVLVGSTMEVKHDQVHVCSPLGVVPKKNGKLRLILDFRFLNKHLAKGTFKFEDLQGVAEILQPDDSFLLSIFAMVTTMLTFFKSIGSIWLFPLLSMVSCLIFCFVHFLLV